MKVIPEDTALKMVPSAPSSIHTAMFEALEDAQQQVFPSSTTLPVMQTGATDSSFLRARGVQAYGLPFLGPRRRTRPFTEMMSVCKQISLGI